VFSDFDQFSMVRNKIMVSRVVTVSGEFFEEFLPDLDLWEVQIYLYIAYELRWSSGKPVWLVLDQERLWEKFGLEMLEIKATLKRLQKRGLIEFKSEQKRLYARLVT
jgi:DNA-binding MarR family transcriptional regulator